MRNKNKNKAENNIEKAHVVFEIAEISRNLLCSLPECQPLSKLEGAKTICVQFLLPASLRCATILPMSA